MNKKFDYYEVVIVNSKKIELKTVNGSEGVILGVSQNKYTQRWFYSVSIVTDENSVWEIAEDDLQKTGKKMDKNEIYNNENL